MPFGFSLPRCFSSTPRLSGPTKSVGNFLHDALQSLDDQRVQLQEAKSALRKAKSAHNQMVLDLVAKGFSAHYVSDKSRRDWRDTISVLSGLYSSSTIYVACHELGL